MKNKDIIKIKINPNKLSSRDLLMVKIICGATKSGFHKNKKKDKNKKECKEFKKKAKREAQAYRWV